MLIPNCPKKPYLVVNLLDALSFIFNPTVRVLAHSTIYVIDSEMVGMWGQGKMSKEA